MTLGWSPGNPFAPASPTAEIVVFVGGRPAPQGSKKPVGRGISVESSRHLPKWRRDLVKALKDDGRKISGPVYVECWFVLRRPQRIVDEMTGLGKNVGDGDKLTRAVWDALTIAGTIDDDSRALEWHGSKRVAEPGEHTGVLIVIRPYVPRRSTVVGLPSLP
jgi:crossover junction endodeoxyribonuclease RusA